MSSPPSRSLRKTSSKNGDAGRGPATTGNRVPRERAFLIGLDLRTRSRGPASPKARSGPLTAAAQAARDSSTAKLATKAPDIPEFSAEESLAELRSLAISAGAEIVGEFLQHRDRPDPATLIGSGKLEEIAGATASVSADLLLFDHDLTASQQRNIEKLVNTRVIDRTQLILDIFAKHARTREGQLQVELAQLEYMLPRLGGRGIEMSQLGGGIGTRGPGETQLETDRRKIHRRIRHVKEQIENVRRVRAQQRARREAVPVATVALVGYTNAGKSTSVQRADPCGGAAIPANVCHARPYDSFGGAALAKKSAALGHGRVHPQPAAHAGVRLSRHARGSAARLAGAASFRCQQPACRKNRMRRWTKSSESWKRTASRACG